MIIGTSVQPSPFPQSAPPPNPSPLALILPLILGALVLGLSIAAAVRTWRRGHKLLFLVGFVAPLAWFVGVFLRPPKDGEWI
jgi:hypothetical protein